MNKLKEELKFSEEKIKFKHDLACKLEFENKNLKSEKESINSDFNTLKKRLVGLNAKYEYIQEDISTLK